MPKINLMNISTSGFDADALETLKNGDLIINFADLMTTGDIANGIFASASDVRIRNFGAIETSGEGAAGIFLQGESARVENFATVVTHGDFYNPSPVFGDEFFSEGIFVDGDRFYIANYGTVHVDGLFSSGIDASGVDGLIVNYGAVEAVHTSSGVIAAAGDRSQAINLGRVTVVGDDNTGLLVLGDGGSAINRGEVVVTGKFNEAISGVVANSHIVNDGVVRVTGDFNFGLAGFGNGHEVRNSGLVEMHGFAGFGMAALGGGPDNSPGLDNELVNAGSIITVGDFAVGAEIGLFAFGFAPAASDQIVNSGVIDTEGEGAAGVVMIGDGHHLTNSGRITADGGVLDSPFHGQLSAAGVLVSGDGVLVENTRTGIIASENSASAAVELNVVQRPGLPAADTASNLENFGLIQGVGVAVLGGAGEETVINHGSIVGDVLLGNGADTFVFGRGGVLDGDLFLGGGEDLVRIEDGSGTSRIADFASGDVVDVSAFFSSFGELTAHSSQSGDDAVIALDHNDALVLSHVLLGPLTANDFLFV